MSINAHDWDTPLDKRTLFTMSKGKYQRMKLERGVFVGLVAGFWLLGADNVSVRTLLEAEKRLHDRRPREVLGFALAWVAFGTVLRWHRLRSIVVGSLKSFRELH